MNNPDIFDPKLNPCGVRVGDVIAMEISDTGIKLLTGDFNRVAIAKIHRVDIERFVMEPETRVRVHGNILVPPAMYISMREANSSLDLAWAHPNRDFHGLALCVIKNFGPEFIVPEGLSIQQIVDGTYGDTMVLIDRFSKKNV